MEAGVANPPAGHRTPHKSWRGCLLGGLLLISTSAPGQFRASVDLVVVEVAVLDSAGRPVEGLTTSDFDVTVSKRPSSVVAVDFLRVTNVPTALAGGVSTAGDGMPSGLVSRPRSRSVVFVLDDLSFEPTPAKEIGLAFERLLPLLGTSDLVGFTTTSRLGPSVAPTLDRVQILDALSQLSGRRETISAPFFIGIDEALASASRSASTAMVRRECEILTLGEGCGTMVRAAARREAIAAVHRTESQMAAVVETILSMRDLPEPRLMILVSDGIATDARNDLADQLRAVSETATSAGVLVYALTGVGDGADVSDITFERRGARVAERRFLASGVQTLASAAGGQSFVVVGQPNRFLQRIVMETSAVYQLAVQIPPPSAGESRYLDIKVKVKRRGLTVRVKPLALRASR